MKIRKATSEDFNILSDLYEQARIFMAQHGNPTQWGNSYPPAAILEQDIADGNSYVCEENGVIHATFYFCIGKDDTYARIYEGEWLNESPYGVVHRITSDGKIKGAASYCIDWAFKQCGNLKIDTHRNNQIMQHLLDKNGFAYTKDLRYGDYKFHETDTPKGYWKSDKEYSFNIAENGKTYVKYIKNSPIQAKVRVIKVDSKDGQPFLSVTT